MTTKDNIIKNAKIIVSKQSFENLSMRYLASQCGIALSVIYHYFSNKEELLRELYHHTFEELEQKREELLPTKTLRAALKQEIEFQMDNANTIVFAYKYFLSNRSQFRKNETGYLPEKLYLPLVEIFEQAKKTKEYKISKVSELAKITSHITIATIMEYYPKLPKDQEREEIIQSILSFILSSLK